MKQKILLLLLFLLLIGCTSNNFSGWENNGSIVNTTSDVQIGGELEVRNITSPFINQSYIFFQSDGSVGITLDPIIEPKKEIKQPKKINIQSTYSRGRETHCKTEKEKTICYTVGYSGTKFIFQEGKWIDMKEARSLNEFYTIRYLKDDGIHDFELINLNYTSIEFKVFVKDSKQLNKDIPFKVDNVQKTTIKLTSLETKSTLIFSSDDILSKNYTFGTFSTVIILQDADSENLADGRTQPPSPDTNFGGAATFELSGEYRAYLTFLLTGISAGSTITDSVLYLFGRYDEGTDAATIHHVNTSWGENIQTHNNQVCGANFDNAGNCNLTAEDTVTIGGGNGWQLFNATLMTKKSFDQGDNNVSVVVKMVSGDGTAHSFWTKEGSGGSDLFPFLNVTFEPVIDTLPPDYSNFAKNVSDGNIFTDSAIQFNQTITDASNSVLYWNFSWNCTSNGAWVNVTNSTDLTDPSQSNNSIEGLSVGTKCDYMYCASDDQGNLGCDILRTFTIQKRPSGKKPRFFIQDLENGVLFYVDNVGDAFLRSSLEVRGNITGNQIYGEINVHPDGNFTTIITTQDVAVNITNFDTSRVNGFTFQADDSLIALVNGTYQSDYWVSYAGGAGRTYETVIAINGNHTVPHAHRKQGNQGDIGSVSGGGIVSIGEGDVLTLQISNTDGTQNVDIFYAGMRFIRIGS